MILLHNGCYCSDLSVHPKNWNETGATTKKDWYIHYQFHDPRFSAQHKYGKLVLVKGMNSFKNVTERRAATKMLLDKESYLLKFDGYNPITKQLEPSLNISYEIAPDMPILKALESAKGKLKLEPASVIDIKSMLKYFGESCKELNFDFIQIKDIRRRHIIIILEHVEQKRKLSSTNYNKYVRYLSMLFNVLVDYDTIEGNYIRDIKKRKITKKIRLTLTAEERIKVANHLKSNHYNFYRFAEIFFQSGSRVIELLRVQKKDVDLKNQTVKYLVKKGPSSNEVLRPITNYALPFWTEVVQKAKSENDYLFSLDLMPGTKKINREQITKRWETHVKSKLKIKADFYSLKHLFLTEVTEKLNDIQAALLASHTTTSMVNKVYDVNNSSRKFEQLRNVNIQFDHAT